MSQNPYAAYDPSQPAPEARTSAMAIVSLVCSLLCCIPFITGGLAVLLGTVAILRIGGSGGRRKGTGLAIAGLIIGLIVTIVWIIAFALGAAAVQEFNRTTAPFVESMNMADATKLRSALDPNLSSQVTDKDWADFKSQIEAELGTIEPFSGALAFIGGYFEAGELLEKHRGSRNKETVPIPVKGTLGYGMMLIELPPGRRNSGNSAQEAILGNAVNIGVILPSGKTVYLVDPDAPKTVPAPKPTPQLPPPGGEGV
ncbi:MAG TPA: DUF4190 domain-containing protein [Phycisphaerales bacterium]|nr:DUF4190 domain-containing protein [Phycisphaerales bacterium]